MTAVVLISVLSAAIFGNVWNFKIQVFFQGLILGLFSFIFLSNAIKKGFVKIPFEGRMIAGAALLSALAWAFSPIRNILTGELINLFCGFSLIWSVSSMKDEVKKRKSIIYFVLFISLLSGFYQLFSHGEPYATLKNSNTMAFYSILAAGLCLEWGNYYLALSFLILIFVSKSAGAILAIFFASLLYSVDMKAQREFKKNPILSLIAIVLLVAAFISMDLSSIKDRLHWWRAALLMIFERPFLGWGSGAFAFAGSAFKGPISLGSIYAHNYYLEFILENGIFSAFLWFAFLYIAIKKTSGFLRYALFAAMAHGLFDFGLSTPYGFWLFCFSLGLSLKNEEFKVNASFLKFFGVASFSFLIVFLQWGLENVKKENFILGYVKDKNFSQNISLMLEKKPLDYDLLSFKAKNLLAVAKEKKDKKILYESARTFEKKLFVNPYNISDYIALEKIYYFLGENSALEELREREKKFLKWN